MAACKLRNANATLNNTPECDLIMDSFNDGVKAFRAVQHNMDNLINGTTPSKYYTSVVPANLLLGMVAIHVVMWSPTAPNGGVNGSGAGACCSCDAPTSPCHTNSGTPQSAKCASGGLGWVQ